MTLATDVEARARLSLGTSAGPIYRTVELLAERAPAACWWTWGAAPATCGGRGDRFTRYIGADVVTLRRFPADGEFRTIDTDTGRVQLGDGVADVVTAVETIEHVENRACRELTCAPDLVVTTPNS